MIHLYNFFYLCIENMHKNNFIPRFFIDIVLQLFIFYIYSIYTKNLILDLNYFIIIFLSWYFITWFCNLYISIFFISFAQEIIRLFKSIFILFLIISCLNFFILNEKILMNRYFSIYFSSISFFTLIFAKYYYRVYKYKLRKKNNEVKSIITFGINNIDNYKSKLNINYLNYTFIPIGYNKNHSVKQQLADLELTLSLKYIDIHEVIIAKNAHTINIIDDIINICEIFNKRIYFLNETENLSTNTTQFNNFIGIQHVSFQYYPLNEIENKYIKRIFDIIFSLLFIVIFYWWIYVIIAILIKLNSRGKIMFRQTRWGLNNIPFVCYKFRTMYNNAHEVDKAGNYVQTTSNDSRITTIGKILRKTSLDELPQIWNVFKGDMSIVGPRPHPVALNEESKDIIYNYLHRHLIKPGLTGWAQVNGFRGEIKNKEDMQKRIDYDVWYIQHWRLDLDIQIIIQTIINIIKGDEKAY